MHGIMEIEHFDKDGNLVRSYQCANEVTSNGYSTILDPPVKKDETRRTPMSADLNSYPNYDRETGRFIIKSECTDCKGTGYYYPLIGPRERCQTCNS